MTEEKPFIDTSAIETEQARVFLLNGQSFGIAIVKNAWAGYIKEIQADRGIYTADLSIPITAIACIVRGQTLTSMQQMMGPSTPVYQGRMN